MCNCIISTLKYKIILVRGDMGLEYTLLEKLFYKNRKQYETEYLNRFNSISTVKLDVNIENNQAFFMTIPEMMNKLYSISEINNKLNFLTEELPGIALEQYSKRCLIEEIILTNEIEGVISTRKDITEILENVGKKEEHKRLVGSVNKYLKLTGDETLSIRNCQDVRDIYEDLLWEEIYQDDSKNLPDGVYFRKEGVNVVSQFGKVIHKGLMPESEINRTMMQALDILNDDKIIILLRIAIFHYLFGYIHPFYDGNGRISRFISSYLLSKHLNTLTGYRLAYIIKENINLYYNSFKMVNEPKNKGDITPFIIMFLDIILKMINELYESLSEKSELICYYSDITGKISEGNKAEGQVIFVLFQETLFGNAGIGTEDLISASDTSEYKVRQVLKKLKNMNLLNMNKIGKKILYSFNLDIVSNKFQ